MTEIYKVTQTQSETRGLTRLLLKLIIIVGVISVSEFVAIPAVAGQTVVGTITLTRGDNNSFSALIDSAHGFAYFATDTEPGVVVKVRLSDFTRVGSLVLFKGDNFLSAAVIDTNSGFAYFGSFFSDRIEKVRLSDFTEVASISARPTPRFTPGFTTAVIDTTNGFAYFGDYGGYVVKIRLLDFTKVGVLALPNGFGTFGSIIDTTNGFAYFSTQFAPGTIYKISLPDFTLASSLSIAPGLGPTPLIDIANGLSYWGTLGAPASILRIRLSDFTITGNLTLGPTEGDLNSAVINTSEGTALFATGTTTSPSEIIKINLSDFKRDSSLTLASYETLLFLSAGSVIDTEAPGGTFAYFSTYTSPSFVIKVKLSNMSRAGTLKLQQGEEWLASAVIDPAGGFVYFGTGAPSFGTGSATGAITKIRLSDFTKVGTLVLNPGEGNLCSAVIDTANGFAYFGAGTNEQGPAPGIIIKVRLSDFTRVAALTLNPDESGPCTGAIDSANGFAYFGTQTFPGTVVKIRLSDFTRVGAITLNLGEDFLTSTIIDVSSGFVYFGTADFPGVIVKVRTSDLTEMASLTLNTGEDEAVSAVIDPSSGFAYFGTFEGIVTKISLSTFSEVGSLTLSPPDFLGSAVIDVPNGFAYFGGVLSVTKVQLSTFTQVGSAPIPINGPGGPLTSAAIDTAAGQAYFGESFSPGRIYKISLT